MRLTIYAVAATLSLGAVASFVAYHKGVERERDRVMAEQVQVVRALVGANLRTRQQLDAAHAANAALGAQVEAKEAVVARLARERDQLWNRRADEDAACAAWFDAPVACRLRGEAAAPD